MGYERGWGYIGPGLEPEIIQRRPGQHISGQAVGLLQTHSWMPKPPGHVSCKVSYPYPVRHMPVRGLVAEDLIEDRQELLPDLIEAGQRIERELGARIIGSSCGYFGNFQAQVVEHLDTPTYLSSIIQVPWALAGMQPEQKLGILCADEPRMTWELMESCGCTREDYERCVICGAQSGPMFQSMRRNEGHYDIGAFGRELVALAIEFVAQHEEIGALLLECTEMPSYAPAIQAATDLPVYDYITLLDLLQAATCQRPHDGFI